MTTRLNPATLAPPFARYSHGAVVEAGQRLVFTSGQLGVAPDGAVPDGCAAQAELCFRNIAAILADAGMSLSDIVRINAYVTDRAHMADYMKVRDAQFPGEPSGFDADDRRRLHSAGIRRRGRGHRGRRTRGGMMAAQRYWWSDYTSPEFHGIDPMRTIAILPIAATEQHGPHLPLCTDSAINRGHLDALIASRARWARFPHPAGAGNRQIQRASAHAGHADLAGQCADRHVDRDRPVGGARRRAQTGVRQFARRQ